MRTLLVLYIQNYNKFSLLLENIEVILMILPVRGATVATCDVTVMWSILHIGT